MASGIGGTIAVICGTTDKTGVRIGAISVVTDAPRVSRQSILLQTLRRALVALAVAGSYSATTLAATSEDQRLLHVLSRTTFGIRPGDLNRVRRLGLDAYIEQQLHPERIDDRAVERALAELPTLTESIPTLLREYPKPDQGRRPGMTEPAGEEKHPKRILAELQAAKTLRAVQSERQLQEVMVDFWFNHFNVFAGKGEVRWYVTAYERDAIRPHALGKFRDLVRATARHPAMLFYLDNWRSVRAGGGALGPPKGNPTGLNENYARELMELHTLGVDGGYTQRDVTEVARAFTGWTIDKPRERGQFVVRTNLHDRGEKTVLGLRIPAGGGQEDGERVIDILTRHPSTARFIATKLVRRFVTDAPPPDLVERVASVYQRTDGDIRAMLRAIFSAPEFYGHQVYRAKIKAPFEFIVSGVRALGGTVEARGALTLAQMSAKLGEGLYLCPPPTGYPDRGEQWVNTGSLLGRMNFALALAQHRLPGVTVSPDALLSAVDRRTPETVLDALLGTLLHQRISPDTRAVLVRQLNEPRITRKILDDPEAEPNVELLIALVLGAPEFQRR